jgi:hypothetical protein
MRVLAADLDPRVDEGAVEGGDDAVAEGNVSVAVVVNLVEVVVGGVEAIALPHGLMLPPDRRSIASLIRICGTSDLRSHEAAGVTETQTPTLLAA